MRPEHKQIMKQRQRNLRLTVAYDGTHYHGFQRQNKVVAVQNVLEAALSKLCREAIELAAAGRTDAGVHAQGQVVNFFTNTTIPINNFTRALNNLLPPDIVVTEAAEASRDFSALHCVKSKRYIYKVHYSPLRDPFRDRYSYRVDKPLNYRAMKQALIQIIGEHDFSSFKSSGGNDTSPIRELYEATCQCNGNEYCFSFWGNGFLYHMVRNLMGVIINIGLERISPDMMGIILAARDRTKAGKMVPAMGLYLNHVWY